MPLILAAALLVALSACSFVPGLKPVPKPVTPLEPVPTFAPEPLRAVYSKKVIDYFSEIAFGAEYGSGRPDLHKWTDDVRIKVHGDPTPADNATLRQVVSELNELVQGISLGISKKDANVEIHFAPEGRFRFIVPNYVAGNSGFFWVQWNETGAINNATILIASERVTQQERSHLIREELTQSLGLMKDSSRYPDSIFYQGWTDTTDYAPIDRDVIRLLYDPRLELGMTRHQLDGALAAQATSRTTTTGAATGP